MNYRNTPLEEVNLSPAQLMMGRRLKTSLPTTTPLLKPQAAEGVQNIFKKQKENQKKHYDKRSGKELPLLKPGDSVRMQQGKKWIPVTVSRHHRSSRLYVAQNEQGQKSRRNRRHLRREKTSTNIRELSPDNNRETSARNIDKQSNSAKVTTKSGRISYPPDYF